MEKKIGNLQELYDQNRMFYHCNACGDINVPGKPDLYCGSVDELPTEARELYETLWSEGSGWPEYVVTLDGKVGMAISIGIWRPYIDNLCANDTDKRNLAFVSAVSVGKNVAQQLLERMPDGEVYYGKDTDPCGDEVVVICLGKAACDEHWETIKSIASEFFYPQFEREMAAILKNLKE